jgi:hypothetical protein
MASTYAYRLVYRGETRTEGVAFNQTDMTADVFAATFGALLDQDPDATPLPHPVELRVWAGEDTSGAPDAVHVRRRRVRGRELVTL